MKKERFASVWDAIEDTPDVPELIPHENYLLIYEVVQETVWILSYSCLQDSQLNPSQGRCSH